MPNYRDLIGKVIQAKQTVQPEPVWEGLCALYCAEARLKMNLYPSGQDYFRLAEWFVRHPAAESGGQSLFFLPAVNHFFAAIQLKPEGSFARLLEAFLQYYPHFIQDLNDNVRGSITFDPYAFAVAKSDVDQIIAALYQPGLFGTASALCLLVSPKFTAYDLNQVVTQLGVNLASNFYGVAQAARITLKLLCHQYNDFDITEMINLVCQKLQNATDFERKNEIAALSEIANLPQANLPVILSALQTFQQDESPNVRLEIVHALRKITRVKNIDLARCATLLFFLQNDSSKGVMDEAQELWLDIAARSAFAASILKRVVAIQVATHPWLGSLGHTIVALMDEMGSPNFYASLNMVNSGKEKLPAVISAVVTASAEIGMLNTELAVLDNYSFCDTKKIDAVRRLAEIASRHEKVAIVCILPVFCKKLQTEAATIVNCIATTIVDLLPQDLKNYFLFGLLIPCLDAATDPAVRLPLLLAREKISHDGALRLSQAAAANPDRVTASNSAPPSLACAM